MMSYSTLLKKDWSPTTLEHKKELLRETVKSEQLKMYHFRMKVCYKYITNPQVGYEEGLVSYLMMLMPRAELGLSRLSIRKYIEEERMIEFHFESYLHVKSVFYNNNLYSEGEEELKWFWDKNPDYYELPKAPDSFDLNDPFFLNFNRPEILSTEEVYEYEAKFSESNVEEFFEWFSQTPGERDFVYSFYSTYHGEKMVEESDYGCWLWRKELFPMQARDITLEGYFSRMNDEEKIRGHRALSLLL